jgi:ribosomal protein S18 acetylase RimI-like enzyme
MFRCEGDVGSTNIQIRRLMPGDAGRYRELRLEALQRNPEAFGSTFEAENAEPLAFFSGRLESSEVFGAFHDSQLVGVAGLLIQKDRKEAHKGYLWGMYVRPAARKSGVGRRLAEAIIECAKRCVEIIQLAVVSDNEPARRLYTSLGFLEYGVERKALKHHDRYYDEVLMAMDLRTE